MNLWLDDLRDPAMYGHIGWHWVKTAEDAIEALKTGTVERCSLDHDLTIAQTLGNEDGKPTGLTVAIWMLENRVFPVTKCHSMNPLGKDRIEGVLRRFPKPPRAAPQ